MDISRRNFVKMSSLAPLVYVLPFGSNLELNKKSIEDGVTDLYNKFQSPPNTARPFVRWWWNGAKVDERELLRELDLLKEKGISGVEINTIKFPHLDNPMGYKSFDWLSDGWLRMLKTTLKGASNRKMTCDIIMGSGWPFGGDFLTKEEQTQLLALGTKNIKGPKLITISKKELINEVDPPIYSKSNDPYKELLVLRLAPAFMEDFNPGINLDDQVNREIITIKVPEGEHVLYYLVKLTGFEDVINGAPGARGPVLNHYNKRAVQKYLNQMSDAIRKKIGPLGDYFRSVFVDSLELAGANWCDDMLDEFENRRGYKLDPYLPFILFKIKGMAEHIDGKYGTEFSSQSKDLINRARYDFEITRLELFQERFLSTFLSWCRKNGVKSRVQAYGREYLPLESSMLIDIPECETWLRSDVGYPLKRDDFVQGRAYTEPNKFVSSAARLAGKRQVSCEEETNTSMVFNATLERIKITGDQSNLSGVTHSVLHGFNYSPKEVPFPGWVRYGTFFNERNPWWAYLKRWIDYKSRLSAVFLNSELQSNVAIMYPRVDLWSKYGVQWDPWPQFNEPLYAFNVWEAVHQNGDGCDYVDENIIQNSTFLDGELLYGSRGYRILLMLEVESIKPETSIALEKFVRAGGTILFVGKEPVKSPGLYNYQKNDQTVLETIQRMKREFPKNVVSYSAPKESIIKWYGEIQLKFSIVPFVKFDHPVWNVSQVHYKTQEADIFFIVNYSLEESHSFVATFNIQDKTAWLWDPETGEKYIYPYEGSKNILKFDLDPATSRLIIFTKEDTGAIYPDGKIKAYQEQILHGPWKVTLNKVNGEDKEKQFDKLIDLKEDKELESFAGVIYYEKKFEIDLPDKYNYIDMGEVHSISEVWVNKQPLGFKWYGKHIYELNNSLIAGENNIKIKVTTVLGNYAKSLEDNKVTQQWTMDQPFYSLGLVGPVRLL